MKNLVKKFIAGLWIFPAIASAQITLNPPTTGGGVGEVQLADAGSIQLLIQRIGGFMATLIISISVLIFLYAAFLYLTGGENEENATKARSLMTYAIIGILVASVAFSLPFLIVRIFGGAI